MGKEIVVNANKDTIAEELAQYKRADGRWQVYVKPYTAELKADLEEYRTSKRAAETISVTEKNGTYKITSKNIMHDFRDLRNSLWFMIFWKYRCEARSTFATDVAGGDFRKLHWYENNVDMAFNEENKDYHFYVVTLSPKFIEATCLPRFYIPAA